MQKKGIMTFIFIISFFLFPSMISAENQVYQVDPSVLMVREDPSSNADVIGRLQAGDRVKVFDEKYGWFQTYVNGEKGWIASHYLFPVNDTVSEAPAQKEVTVTGSGVRVRTGPSTSHEIQDYTSLGDTLTVTDSSGDWLKININDGQTGWIAGWLTTDGASKQESSSSSDTAEQVAAVSTDAASKDLTGYNIVLDPGHGGEDPGAIGFDGVHEKDLTLEIVDTIKNELENAGATVILTRNSDRYISHSQRVSVSHNYNTHVFLSLHFNANPLTAVNGISTYYFSPSSRQLAYNMQASLANHTSLRNRGVMHNGFYVLRNNMNNALLLELGFITNPHDLQTIRTAAYQSNISKGIKNALADHVN